MGTKMIRLHSLMAVIVHDTLKNMVEGFNEI